MATGFMTLPLPALGNTYAPSYNGGPDNHSARGTPAIYWAVLWNRCMAIIDDHDHGSGETGTVGVGGSLLGKKLTWGDWETGGILVSEDLDMGQRALTFYAHLGFSRACTNLNFASLNVYSNPVTELSDLGYGIHYGDDEHGNPKLGSDKFPINDTYKFRSCLYARMEYAAGSDISTSDQNANFSNVPRTELIWNNGGREKEGCVLVTNEPAGGRFNWQVALTGYLTSQGRYSQNWQNADKDWALNYSEDVGVRFMGPAPFSGLLDTGVNGFKPSYQTIYDIYTIQSEIYNAYGINIHWSNGSTTGGGVRRVLIQDDPGSMDPGMEIPLPYNKAAWVGSWGSDSDQDANSDADRLTFFSYNDVFPLWGNYKTPFRSGKMFWITDGYGNAGTVPVEVWLTRDTLNNSSTQWITLRWFDSTGAAKYGYSTSTPGWNGDTLSVTDNYGSLLLVKYDQPWATSDSVPATDKWLTSTGTMQLGPVMWFAYFV